MQMACRFLLLALASAWTPHAAAAQRGPTIVIVVRHAEKDIVPANDPPLTAARVERAAALASALSDAGVGAIITTQLVRTRDTARPLAERLGLTPQVVVRGADIAAHARAVAAAVR
jgi:broad specificity phosphatase PhoE